MMRFRRERVLGRELLETASPADAAANLSDIARINRWFGGHAILRRLLRECFGREPFTALDVGAASGDLARAAPPNARVVCCDLQVQHLATAPHPKLAADAHRLPFPDRAFDAVWCSLFLHHFEEAEAACLLAEMRRVARRYVIAIDLVRHRFPYHFLPLTRPLLGWTAITVHDGMASVQAGFTAPELAAVAHRAGLCRITVRRHWLWQRLSVVAPVDGPGPGPPL